MVGRIQYRLRSGRRLVLALAVVIVPGVASAFTTAPLAVNEPFTWLDAGMPESLAIGQEVRQLFTVDTDAVGLETDEGLRFWDGVVDYDLTIPDIGFAVDGGTGDVLRTATGDLVLTAYPSTSVFLDEMEFLYASVTLVPTVVDSALMEDPLRNLALFAYGSFAVSFFDSSTAQTSSGVFGSVWSNSDLLISGVEVTAKTSSGMELFGPVWSNRDLFISGVEVNQVPEPRFSALAIGGLVLLLASARRKRG